MVITFKKKSSLHSYCRNCCAHTKKLVRVCCFFLGSSSGVGNAVLFLECSETFCKCLTPARWPVKAVSSRLPYCTFVTNAASSFPWQIHFAKPSANAFLEHLTLEFYFMHLCHPLPPPLVGTRGIIVLIFPVHFYQSSPSRRDETEVGGTFAPKIVRSWHVQTGACTEWLPREKYSGFFFS